MNNKINKDNINLINVITWYDINENGYVKDCFFKQSVVYIYKVISSNNKTRYYVGSSINISNRLSDHRSRVIRWSKDNSKGGSPIFYNSVLKYGWNSFQFGILEYINIDKLNNKSVNEIKRVILDREQYYLDLLNPSLNACKIANSPLGIKRNKNFSINLSLAKRGKKHNKPRITVNIAPKICTTTETRLKMSERARGVSVKVLDKFNNIIKEFPNMKAAADYFNVGVGTISRIFRTGVSYDDYNYKFETKDTRIWVYGVNNNFINVLGNLKKASLLYEIPSTTLYRYIKSSKLYKNKFYFKVK